MSTIAEPRTLTDQTRTLSAGVLAGLAASVAMAMWAMGSAWEKGSGFFTPLYHIASLWISPSHMVASMQAAMSGSAFHFEAGPAALGAAIHMMTGAMFGMGFVLLVRALPAARLVIAGVGVVYGAVVFAVSAFVLLPMAASMFGSGDAIAHMARLAGWGTFAVEHLIYGLVLGILTPVLVRRAH